MYAKRVEPVADPKPFMRYPSSAETASNTQLMRLVRAIVFFTLGASNASLLGGNQGKRQSCGAHQQRDAEQPDTAHKLQMKRQEPDDHAATQVA